MDNLPKCGANYVPLTPLTFLSRAAKVYANRTSIIYGLVHFNWSQTYDRCCRLASSLQAMGISKNDVVSVLAPNIPAMYEMHFAVPMAGAVLNAMNTRLDARTVATILKHSEAKFLFVDYEYLNVATEAINLLMSEFNKDSTSPKPMSLQSVIIIDDLNSPKGVLPGQLEYEELIIRAKPGFNPGDIVDEWDPIALNYTSGTTAEPKGVVYSHRGAYLSTLSLILGWNMGTEPVYLWSLPMFHCNGWTFTWGIAARGGTNVCMRTTAAKEMYHNIVLHNVTHMCCAPIVFNIILQANFQERRKLTKTVEVLTGGAPPPAAILHQIERLGFHVVHAYGLTEATGPALVCEWQEQWNKLPESTQAEIKARQGISILTLADVDVKNIETMASVPRDGKTMGEIVLRGSSLMKGYLKNDKANTEAFKDGWFLTGDMGVVHPDGYLEIKDRSKDVIISGGENISSVEVENALYKYTKILEASVVAMPHEKWGESPCAFVVLKKTDNEDKETVNAAEIIDHCRKNLPHYMVPKRVVFLEELPKINTGKVLKFQLRAMARNIVTSELNHGQQRKTSTNVTQVNMDLPRYEDEPQGIVLALSRL